MKINIEDYLHQIDAYFKDKSSKDTYMTYIMAGAVIFAFSYLLFWDSSFNNFESTRNNVVSLNSNISNDERFLRNNSEQRVTSLSKEIEVLNKEIIIHKDRNAYIKHKIEEISSLIYDERTWGEYLYSISKNAKRNNIKILEFTNKYADNNRSFGHILDISLKSKGNYINTINFINSLEQSDLVVDVHDLVIESNSTLNSELNISVWGITY